MKLKSINISRYDDRCEVVAKAKFIENGIEISIDLSDPVIGKIAELCAMDLIGKVKNIKELTQFHVTL